MFDRLVFVYTHKLKKACSKRAEKSLSMSSIKIVNRILRANTVDKWYNTALYYRSSKDKGNQYIDGKLRIGPSKINT